MTNPQDTIFIKGDTIDLQFQLFTNKATNTYWVLTNNEIRFQLNTPTKIYKATANVTGGGTDQISIVNASQGIFMVHIDYTESSAIAPGDYDYEIQVTIPSVLTGVEDQKYTVLQSSLRIGDESISWEAKP